MNWTLFLIVYAVGVALVVLQGVFAYQDGYFSETQMREVHGITNGWAFMQHGGMWADVFIISPMVAYVVSNYQIGYFRWYSVVIFLVAIVASLLAGNMYQKAGMVTPEAHTHDGITTAAGWIHGLFAVVAIWAIVMFYLATPGVTTRDLIVVACILTPFFFLGVYKFSSRWTFDSQARAMVFSLTPLLWVATLGRIWFKSKYGF